jgi:hypothetical protein
VDIIQTFFDFTQELGQVLRTVEHTPEYDLLLWVAK